MCALWPTIIARTGVSVWKRSCAYGMCALVNAPASKSIEFNEIRRGPCWIAIRGWHRLRVLAGPFGGTHIIAHCSHITHNHKEFFFSDKIITISIHTYETRTGDKANTWNGSCLPEISSSFFFYLSLSFQFRCSFFVYAFRRCGLSQARLLSLFIIISVQLSFELNVNRIRIFEPPFGEHFSVVASRRSQDSSETHR